MMNKLVIENVNLNGLDDYKKRYLDHISPDQTVLEALKFSNERLVECLHSIDEDLSQFAYQPNKWDIKTMLLHICDTERVFQYRALCLARDHNMVLVPFDENIFAEKSEAHFRSFIQILNEYKLVHGAGFSLFESFNSIQLLSNGSFNGQQVSPALFGFLIAGHRLHHLEIIQTRYLSLNK